MYHYLSGIAKYLDDLKGLSLIPIWYYLVFGIGNLGHTEDTLPHLALQI